MVHTYTITYIGITHFYVCVCTVRERIRKVCVHRITMSTYRAGCSEYTRPNLYMHITVFCVTIGLIPFLKVYKQD